MSDKIKAGCIVKTKFVKASSDIFGGYIDYIDRENAVRNDAIPLYSIYSDYMDNPEKTTDLFTASSDHLNDDEKASLKKIYEKAQKNGSPMWQTVISFDNRWLEDNGLYDSSTKILNTKKLMEYARNSVNPMLKAEGLENATLSAEQNNPFAQYQLGMIYLKGDIANKDIKKSISFFEASANQDNPFAQYQLGKLYYFGAEGIPADKEKAAYYLTQAASQGNEYAQALLDWKPSAALSSYSHQMSFSETIISLSSNMRSLFERLSNEHDHIINQMVYQHMERETKIKEQQQNL